MFVFGWFDLEIEYRSFISNFASITTYLCRPKLRPLCLKLSDRCKHVHAVVHANFLYTVKNCTEDTAQRSSISVWRYQWELTPYCSQEVIVAWLQHNVICFTLCSPESRLFNQILHLMKLLHWSFITTACQYVFFG